MRGLARKVVGLALLAALVRPASAREPVVPNWRPDLDPNTWTEISPKYKAPPDGGRHTPVSWNKLVYDSVGRRIIEIDRWTAPERIMGTYIYANSLMALDVERNEIERLSLFNWKRLAQAGGGYQTLVMPENKTTPTPCPRHPFGNVAFVPEENAVYLSAGANQTTQVEGKGPRHPNDTWRFDLAVHKWEQLKGDQPPLSLSDSMTYVPDLKAIVRWVAETSEVWIFDIKTYRWSKKPIPDGPPLGRRTATTYDTRRKQVLLYGGQVKGERHDKPGPQLWALDIAEMTWKRLKDGPPVSAAGWVYAPQHDVVLCHRKVNPDTWDTGECWVYFPGEDQWLQLESPKPTPPHLYETLAYDESRDVFVCHTRPLKWYVMRLDPVLLKGAPAEYIKRMER